MGELIETTFHKFSKIVYTKTLYFIFYYRNRLYIGVYKCLYNKLKMLFIQTWPNFFLLLFLCFLFLIYLVHYDILDTWRRTSLMVLPVVFITSKMSSWRRIRLLYYPLNFFIFYMLLVLVCWWSSSYFVLQSHIFLLNCDVCCSFPLPQMLGNFFSRIRISMCSSTCTFCFFAE